MIERQTIDGREATIAYLDADFNPVDKDTPGHYAKILFDDGDMLLLRSQTAAPKEQDGFDDYHQHDAKSWNRHRAKHVSKPLKIHGRDLHYWARALLGNDLKNIESAIKNGLLAGESNTDIAHRVIGSRKHNGANGMTEITRQHVIALGRGYLRKKSRNGPGKTS